MGAISYRCAAWIALIAAIGVGAAPAAALPYSHLSRLHI
jgi:hypothetical protein